MPKPEPAKARRTISPAEKAQEALDIAERRCHALFSKQQDLRQHLDEVTAELDAARARHAYLAANPDLPANQHSVPAQGTLDEQ